MSIEDHSIMYTGVVIAMQKFKQQAWETSITNQIA